MTSRSGLGLIPKEIFDQGSMASINYMLDLFRSPEVESLFRSKVLILGLEKIGKTSLVHALFPLEAEVRLQGLLRRRIKVRLQGPVLTKYLGPDKPLRITLTPENFSVEKIPDMGLRIISEAKGERINLFFDKAETQEEWFHRMGQLTWNKATHGIEIHETTVTNPLIETFFKGREDRKDLELSIWDFAGQNDYYITHQYFLSTWSVFLIVYNLEEDERSLDFWLRSISSRINTSEPPAANEREFSIFVVGTFLSSPKVDKSLRTEREARVQQLALQCGIACGLIYQEVDCLSLENIDILKEELIQVILSHSYITEKIPKSYISIHNYLLASEKKKSMIPIMELDELITQFSDEAMVKKALRCLFLWGKCVYFDEPEELSRIVVLDPRFLTKRILANLFNHDPNIASRRENGFLAHQDLFHIWGSFGSHENPQELFSTFLSLLERFGVCFMFEEDADLPFNQRRSIIPSLLPEMPRQESHQAIRKFREVWPKVLPYHLPIQMERIIKFNLIPEELVGRLVVSLNRHIQSKLLWRHDVVLSMPPGDNLVWVSMEPHANRFVVILRGTSIPSCKKAIESIVSRIKSVSCIYKAVKYWYLIRSPHFSDAEIHPDDAFEDAERPLSARQLICPETHFPVLAEKILFNAGFTDSFLSQKSINFFSFLFLDSFTTTSELVSFSCFLVFLFSFFFSFFLKPPGGNLSSQGHF